jgi:hypothetical protein
MKKGFLRLPVDVSQVGNSTDCLMNVTNYSQVNPKLPLIIEACRYQNLVWVCLAEASTGFVGRGISVLSEMDFPSTEGLSVARHRATRALENKFPEPIAREDIIKTLLKVRCPYSSKAYLVSSHELSFTEREMLYGQTLTPCFDDSVIMEKDEEDSEDDNVFFENHCFKVP